jgi:hypothetical protein
MPKTNQSDYWLVKVLEENTKRFQELPVSLSKANFSYIEILGDNNEFACVPYESENERKCA